jgi:hypothetical protein
MRSKLVVAGLGAAAFVLLRRRRDEARRPHVGLHFGDGSVVTFGAESEEGRRLLALAREALEAARAA